MSPRDIRDGLPEEDTLDVIHDVTAPTVVQSNSSGASPVHQQAFVASSKWRVLFAENRKSLTAALIALFLLVGIGVVTMGVALKGSLGGTNVSNMSSLPQQPVNISETGYDQLLTGKDSQLLVNGQLSVNGSVVLSPVSSPAQAIQGEIYYNKQANQPYYFNGSSYVPLAPVVQSTTQVINTTKTVIQGSAPTVATTSAPQSIIGTANQVTATTTGSTTQIGLPASLTVNDLTASSISGNGSGLTNISSSALPADVAFTDKNNETFTGSNVLFRNSTNSSSAFSIQTASGSTLLAADTNNNALVLGNDGSPSDVKIRGGDATGTNIQGSNLIFQASDGTGAGGSGNIEFQTAAVGGEVLLDSQSLTTMLNGINGVSAYTLPITISSHSSSMLVVSLGYTGYTNGNPPPDISKVTLNGIALTQLYQIDDTCSSGANSPVEVWYLTNPAIGTNNLTIDFNSGYGNAGVVAEEFYNVNLSNPFGTPVSQCVGANSASSVSVTTPTSLGQMVLDTTTFNDRGYTTIVPDSGQTTLGASGSIGVSTKQASGSNTITGNTDSAGYGDGWIDTAVPINTDAVLSQPDALISRLEITASGNVGIDTTTPRYTLDVGGTGNFSSGVLSSALDTAAAEALTIGSANATSLNLGNTTNNIATTINGTTLVKPVSGQDSTTAFQVQNAGGSALFTADTTNNTIVFGSDGTPSSITIRGGIASGTDVAGANLTLDASNGTGSGGSGDLIFRTAAPASTAITLDSGSVNLNGWSTGPITSSLTVAANTNRLLMVSVYTASSPVSSVTWNGTNLTQLATETTPGGSCNLPGGPNDCGHEVWYLINPASGTHNLVVSAGSSGLYFTAEAFYNVNQSSPFGTLASQTGTTNNISQTASTNSNEVVFDSVYTPAAINSAGTGQTLVNGYTYNGPTYFGDYTKLSSGSSTSLSYSLAGTGNWSEITVPINPITSSTPNVLSDRLHITASGNVGIDNSSPNYALDVGGTGNFSNGLLAPRIDTANASSLEIGGTNASSIVIGNTINNIQTSIQGTAIIKPNAGQDSSAVFQVQNASGIDFLNIDTLNNIVTIGGGGTVALGHNIVGTTENNGALNDIEASKITVGGSTEQIGSISVYFGAVQASPNNEFEVAIYTDSSGSPGSLVAGSASTSTTITPNSWNTVNITRTTLSANTSYWLAVTTNATNGTYDQTFYDTGGGNYALMNSTTFGTWPSSFTNNFSSTNTLSIYANVNVPGSIVLDGNVTLSGHLTTGNFSGTTSISAGAAADCGGAATASVSGNDTLGTITVTTGSGGSCSAGVLATINFANAFSSAPKALISPDSSSAASLQLYHTTTAAQLTINTANAPTAGTTYTFDYGTGQ